MKFSIHYNDGDVSVFRSFGSLSDSVKEEYPDAVFYQDGDEVTEMWEIYEGRILVWENEADSFNDDGAKAIASIIVFS